jgi:PAS domain S-box-containing protein
MTSEAKPSILVVEDENVVAMDLVSSLEKLNYMVVGVAASGEDAVELASQRAPDLVLMDIHLRGDMDGIRAAEQIQEKLFIPVVYLTAYSDQSTLGRARVTHPFGYVLKPFEDREIEVAIQMAIFRHTMERALRDNERRLDAILGSIGDAVIATDANKRITFMNRTAEAQFRWSSAQAKGKPLAVVVKGTPHESGVLHVAHGREVTPVEVVESPVVNSNGRLLGYVIVARDVSERIRAQEAHERAQIERAARAQAEKESERARLKSAIGLALADVSRPDEVARALLHVAELIAGSMGSWCGLHVEDHHETLRIAAHTQPEQTESVRQLALLWPAERDARCGPHAVMRTGRQELLETITDDTLAELVRDPEHREALRRAGVASALCVPLRTRQRVIGALSLVSTDPERRYGEAEVAGARQLADRIALALENARLYREAQEARTAMERLYDAEQKARSDAEALVGELERAVRFSEMFAGILGHDLRNPLSSIVAAASFVSTEASAAETPVLMGRILGSAERMGRMIDQLLDFTRARLGRGIPLRRKAVDLGKVCRTVLDELTSRTEQEVDGRVEVRGDPVGTWDEDRLTQLVSNLVGNAYQHRRAGSPVALTIDGSQPDSLTLEVQNEGGIPRELLPVIFEPLHGGSGGRKTEGSSGLGLGLYISQQIAAAHGGTIQVETDGATRFTVKLPRRPASEAEQMFGPKVECEPSATPWSRGTRQEPQAEDPLRVAVQSARVGVFSWDIAADQGTLSGSLERFWGSERGELSGTWDTFTRRVHPDDLPRLGAELARCREAHEDFAAEFRVILPGGDVRWLASRGGFIYDAGEARHMRGLVADVTPRKQAEQAEHERERQTYQAQKIEAIRRLSGGVAHEFNNLLCVIIGYSDLLAAGSFGEEVSGPSLKAIGEAAHRAAKLAKQLLAFSRHTLLQPQELDLGNLVSEAVDLLRHIVGAAVELKLDRSAEDLRVKIDQGQLGHVLVDLTVNAAQAMPEGGELSFETRPVHVGDADDVAAILPAGEYAALIVADTTQRMSEEVRRRVFEPFLGTSSIGHTTIESEPGRGSVFKLYFPRQPAQVAIQRDETARSLRSGETVLLTEDREALRSLATRVLEAQGYRVLSARNGRDALRLLEQHEGAIDLLLTDVNMPVINGPELAEIMLARYPLLKVIYTSGYGSEDLARHGVSGASVIFLQKPYSTAELVRLARHTLDA